MPVVYVYILEGQDALPAVFTWPNVVKKHIRDTYTVDGELHLPPLGRIALKRYKVNPKAGQRTVVDVIDIGEFLAK